MRIYRQHFEQSSKTRRIETAAVKGTTQNKRKREPNESTRNRSRELRNELSSLLRRRQTDSTGIMEEVNLLKANDTEKDLQDAVLAKGTSGDTSGDTRGDRLIQIACRMNAPVEVIQLLLDSDTEKKTIVLKDHDGCLPIHLAACSRRASGAVIQLLLDSDTEKKSILKKDNKGRLPIHTACLHNGPVEVIQLLLQASICDRIEQLGLARWKIGMEKLINDMTVGGRTFMKFQEIYKRLSKYEEMKHSMSLLALVVWRTCCLHWGDIKFKSMQEIEDLRATDDAFDPSEYKRECRIKSGADVIIRGVLPFLPVDDETPTPESSASDDGDDDSDSESSVSDDDVGI